MDLGAYIGFFGDKQLSRFAYLRAATLQTALDDDKIVAALWAELGVEGKPAVVKALSRTEKLAHIKRHVENCIRAENSPWYGAKVPEVLVAALYNSNLGERAVLTLFSSLKGKAGEAALKPPVAAMLKSTGMVAYDEVPLGSNRADVFGFKKGVFSTEFVGVECKDDLKQMKRGLDQMLTFCDYCHRVYLACTPMLAIEFLDQHAAGVKTKHWDFGVLDRKLDACGFGLLLVEGATVYEYKKAKARGPSAKRVAEVELALRSCRQL